MRIMIAVPCLDQVQTFFMTSLLSLVKPEGTEVAVASCSLVYEARHTLALRALNEGFDRVLWLDSDMVFPPDVLTRLSADMDEGRDLVSAVYFTRKNPVSPCVYEFCDDTVSDAGEIIPTTKSVKKIPAGIFEIAACGFGCVLTSTDLIRRAGKLPFFPENGYGEDLSFCRRARAAGAGLYCDGRVKVGHAGISIINETTWKQAKKG